MMLGRLNLRVVPVLEWPEKDQAAWAAAGRECGLFDRTGTLAHASPDWRKCIAQAYGRWLGFLEEQQLIDHNFDLLSDREVVGAYLARLEGVAPYTARSYLNDLLRALTAVAPDRNFELVRKAANFVQRSARPSRDKLPRMVPAAELYALGLDLINGAPSRSTTLKRAGQFRDGLMISMLIAAPMRIGNFISTKIDEHLSKEDDRYALRFEACEVKNSEHLEYMLPPALTPHIEEWLSEYRPECARRRGRWFSEYKDEPLWLSDHGGPFSAEHVARDRIEKRTAARFGNPINPHLFRDIAATSVAVAMPDNIRIVGPMLGHRSYATGERFYNQARSLSASRAYNLVIERFRVSNSQGCGEGA